LILLCSIVGDKLNGMSISLARSNVARTTRDIADLRKKDADQARKESDLTSKINRAVDGARRASSASTATSKLREAERYQNELARVANERAKLAGSLANKTRGLQRYHEQLSSAETKEQKALSDKLKRDQSARDRKLKEFDSQLKAQMVAAQGIPQQLQESYVPDHDVFISHASEDKDGFVRELANRLTEAGLKVWYDEFSLSWGDSLRRNIDKGLAASRFGIVVLSENFFRKEWPQRELDGLVQLELVGRSRILPIWHKVSKDEVARFSPTLADKLALNTGVLTVDEIVAQLKELLSPE
jgi:TIR domain